MWWISAWIPRKQGINIEIFYIMKWYVWIWRVCPISNNWWPVYEWRRAVKRDFELCVSVFLGEHFSFLQAKTINIERLLSYPEKRGENFKSHTKLSQASKARFTKQRNQALQLFVYFYTLPLKPRPDKRNMPTQHIATLLGATCCVRLATVLRCVATCWVLLAQIWPVSNLSQQHATCRDRVAKRAQHVAPNNVGICCAECCDRLTGALLSPVHTIRRSGMPLICCNHIFYPTWKIGCYFN